MNDQNIYIERNSPSDEEFFLHQIYVSNGEYVKKDTLLAEVEGAKAVFELYSDDEGYFYTKFKNGDYIDIDTPLGIISKEKIETDLFEVENENTQLVKLTN